MESALVARAVAEERGSDVAVLLVLVGESGAHGDGRPAADNAVGAEHPDFQVGDMHAAALALAVAVNAPEQLREHPVELAALGDEVAVATMRAGDLVFVRQVRHDADGDRFFADIEVKSAGNETVFRHSARLVFEMADSHHAPMDVEQYFVGRLCSHASPFHSS